jgi:hypothetical protein
MVLKASTGKVFEPKKGRSVIDLKGKSYGFLHTIKNARQPEVLIAKEGIT